VGLFSFIGKAVKSVAGAALSIIPGGGVVKGALGIAQHLLQAKQPMQSTPLKYTVATAYSVPTLRGQIRLPGGSKVPTSAASLRASPVMPGGGIATSQGIMASGGGVPPASYGSSRSSGGTKRRKRRSSASRRSSRARSGKKRKAGTRKLKFGSPAWRKKYMRRG
jgi:hypothetical protein